MQHIIDAIENHPVYKQVLKDSLGGILYDVADIGKYDATEVLALWNSLNDSWKSASGGIMNGAMNFLQED